MKIGILSDTHDQIGSVERALHLLRTEGVEVLLHCGDIESADTIALFAGWEVHFVYGNCDWDKSGLARAMDAIGATNHKRYGHLERLGVTLGWVHGDDGDLLNDLIASNAYDFIFHGHTHVAGERQSGRTRVLNPGAFTRVSRKSVLVLDLPAGEAQWLAIQ